MRTARAICKRIDFYPWYEWETNYEWEDDEFEDIRHGTVQERQQKAKTNSAMPSLSKKYGKKQCET